MKVVKIGTPNLMDVVSSLRLLASLIEEGKEPKPAHAIVVSVDEKGGIRIYAYGEVGTQAHEVGVLNMAAIKLMGTG